MPVPTLWLDLETFSEVAIRNGTYSYAENAEIMLLAWALDDGPVGVWDLTAGTPMPTRLRDALNDNGRLIYAHNAMFDRSVMRLGLNSDTTMRAAAQCIERWRCSMVHAMAHSLPGKLDSLCKIFELEDKTAKKDGTNYIHLFCKPRPKNVKLRRATSSTHPSEWARFVEYAAHDILAMRELVQHKLPSWNYQGTELALWHLDQKINDRGFAVDLDLVDAAVREAAGEKTHLAEEAQRLTDGELEKTTSNNKLLAYVLELYGVKLPDLRAATIEAVLREDDLPPVLRKVLLNRLQATSTSVTKYKALKHATSSDRRMRGSLQFAGAPRTGRWAGRTFQPQNLPRLNKQAVANWYRRAVKEVSEKDVQHYLDFGVEVLKLGGTQLFFDEIMYLCANLVRGCIVAPDGKRLVVTDLSNIEGRVLAWLAGEEWKLDAFRKFDADPKNKALDLYNVAYARSFNIAPGDVNKDERQIGKVQELALGYEGGVGAFITFALAYSLDLDALADRAYGTLPLWSREAAESMYEWLKETNKQPALNKKTFVVCDALKRLWRAAHPATVSLWKELATAVRDAIRNPGVNFPCGKLTVRRKGNWLRIILPSGRCLCYAAPAVNSSDAISYQGQDGFTRSWSKIFTYGGKLVENVTQSVARDVLAAAMPRFESAGYSIVLTAHDELVLESGYASPLGIAHANALLATPPPWAPDLPLAAAGFETLRYRKD